MFMIFSPRTGAVKVTPAHDPNDYDCGKRNNLEFINIFDDDGNVNENGGPFKGMKRFDAREAILKALEEKGTSSSFCVLCLVIVYLLFTCVFLGLYEETTNNEMVLPMCSRTKDIIEPRLKPQWCVSTFFSFYAFCFGTTLCLSCETLKRWVNSHDMANNAVKAVADGRLQIIPDTHVVSYKLDGLLFDMFVALLTFFFLFLCFKILWNRWLENCKDWCISRQLWWGHRIPAYLVIVEGQPAPDVSTTNTFSFDKPLK